MNAPGSAAAPGRSGKAGEGARAPTCRACGSTRVTLRGRKRGEFIQRDFEFFTCVDCRLLFVEPFSGFEIYNDAYYRGEGPDPFVDYETEYRDWRATDRKLEFEDLARLAEAHFSSVVGAILLAMDPDKIANKLAPTPNPPLAWLDFGCGAGGFLKFLRERGSLRGRPLELTGHDVGSYADLLRTKDQLRVLDIEALAREPDGRYDFISMVEVLEHLPDTAAPLALIARLLKPGGLLLLTTGNLAGRIPRRQGLDYGYCVPEVHVSLFNPDCLTGLYRRHGLEPHLARYDGVVKFKVLKTLRHHPTRRALARLALAFPPIVRLVDWLYGVSAMPCAVKPPSS